MSRESAWEAGGRTRSTRGCCAAPPLTPPAEHLLRAGRWDTHPFNAGRASLLHVTYAPPEPGPGFTLSDTPESLFPPTRALSRSRTAWAESLCWAESLSAEHAAAHLTERMRHCPLSARTHLCPAGGPSAAPAPRRWEARPRGLAPGRLCSRGLGLHGQRPARVERLPPSWRVPGEQSRFPCARSPRCHLRAGRRAPAASSPALCLATSEFINAGGIYNAISSSLSSFAAMDGVPFMISEKFSCVPESVSVTLELPPLPPPAARAPSAQQHAGLPRRPSHSCLHGGHFCPAPCPAGSAALRPPTGLPGSCSGPRCPPGLSAGAAHDRRVRVREKRGGDRRAERPSFVVAPVTVTWPELHWS